MPWNTQIDEMLAELRAILEAFDREPTFANFDMLQRETTRLERTCEDAVFAALDAPNVELRGSPASGRVPLERRVERSRYRGEKPRNCPIK